MRRNLLFGLWIVICLSVAAWMAAAVARPGVVAASGNWNGQDTYHSPLSWCALNGSPAVANPNVAGDTDTDSILWRRHERPTDNIFVNPTGITFRSAINSIWHSLLTFPKINDPLQALGQEGDMRDLTQDMTEFNTVLAACRQAWSQMGRAGVGITAINIGLFHDGQGNYVNKVAFGGCLQNAAGQCVPPIDGSMVVVDNHYLYPSVPNRNWPPAPNDPNGAKQFTGGSGAPITDPFDIAAGHAMGRALGLPQRQNIFALMMPSLSDNKPQGTPDGEADNLDLNAAEIALLRTNAPLVPHVEVDPQGEFEPGRYINHRIADAVQERDDLPPHLDLMSVTATLELNTNRLLLDQEVFGLIPPDGEGVSFWYLLDSDNSIGASPDVLANIGVPETAFDGADLVAQLYIKGETVDPFVWILSDGELVEISPDGLSAELLTLVMYALSTTGDSAEPQPANHTARLELPDGLHGMQPDRDFRLHAIIAQDATANPDELADDEGQPGRVFRIELPTFAHCAARADGRPGSTVPVAVEGLLPDAPIHGLLGPDLVFQGQTDSQGSALIDFPIPEDARAGYHLVTIGVDETAFTADCVLNVVEADKPVPTEPPFVDITPEVTPPPTPEVTPPPGDDTLSARQRFALLSSYEDLLRRQQRLLNRLGAVLGILSFRRALPDEQLAELARLYAALLAGQAERLQGFEALLDEEFAR